MTDCAGRKLAFLCLCVNSNHLDNLAAMEEFVKMLKTLFRERKALTSSYPEVQKVMQLPLQMINTHEGFILIHPSHCVTYKAQAA